MFKHVLAEENKLSGRQNRVMKTFLDSFFRSTRWEMMTDRLNTSRWIQLSWKTRLAKHNFWLILLVHCNLLQVGMDFTQVVTNRILENLEGEEKEEQLDQMRRQVGN